MSTKDTLFECKNHNKKLLNLSQLVLSSVKASKMTTGNQIAREILCDSKVDSQDVEFKNIQRRVYDALNVLQAINLVHKVRNQIQYRGGLGNEDMEMLDEKLDGHRSRIQRKKIQVTQLIQHYLSIIRLCKRNMNLPQSSHKFPFPFIMMKSSRNFNISIYPTQVYYKSKQPVELFSDVHIMKMMNLHRFNLDGRKYENIEAMNKVQTNIKSQLSFENCEAIPEDLYKILRNVLNQQIINCYRDNIFSEYFGRYSELF